MKLQQTSTPAQSCNGQPLFYVVDWLPPDFGAVGQYAVLFASEIAAKGRHVELIGLTSGEAGTSQQQFASGGLLRVTRIPRSANMQSSSPRKLLRRAGMSN